MEATHSKIAVVGADDVADFEAANGCWQDGFFKAMPYVRSPEIRERYDALGWVLITCWLEHGRGKFVEVGAILRAIENVRRTCSAFVLEEPLPPPCYPSRGAASGMVKIDPRGESDWSALLEWMYEHPPRRPDPPDKRGGEGSSPLG